MAEFNPQRLWSRVAKTETCWIWQGARGRNGYGELSIGGEMLAAHRLAWQLTNGPIPKGMCVLHRCDVRACCNPTHLFLGTRADNTADMLTKGRHKPGNHQGARNGRAKLSPAQVAQIRTRHQQGETMNALGRAYGVSGTQIHRIITNAAWNLEGVDHV